jgi:hypothetical protein
MYHRIFRGGTSLVDGYRDTSKEQTGYVTVHSLMLVPHAAPDLMHAT